MNVAIINYGLGNLRSVKKSFESIGSGVFFANNPEEIIHASHIVLPGVGAFNEGMKRLHEKNWPLAINQYIQDTNRPLLGICLGMQMLASIGNEGGEVKGLGLIQGTVEKLDKIGCTFSIPHVGWNDINILKKDRIVWNIPDFSDFYFVHSYAFIPNNQSDCIANTSYGLNFSSIIKYKNIYGCQFHPEKSSRAGRQLLENFLNI